MKINDEFVVEIEKLDHQGRGIARAFEKTIFVEGALPDEVVKIKVVKIKKKIVEAKMLEMLKGSSKRVVAPCPYYDRCGGCDLMHLSYEEQLQFKANKVKEIMRRYAGIEEDKIKTIVGSDVPFYYRNKITLQVQKQIGLYQKKSYQIVPIDACMICDAKMNEIMQSLKKMTLIGNGQIIIRNSRHFPDTMVVFVDLEVDGWETLKTQVTSIVKRQGKQNHILYGNDVIYERLKDYIYVISPDSFFQVNTAQTIKLYDKVEEYAALTGDEKVLDLYCGTGTIGIYLSQRAKEVLGMEMNEHAILNANRNKELNHLDHITFQCGDVSKLIDQIPWKPDVVIVDPPRAGLDAHTLQMLKHINPKRIVYVSCDPMTLARDLKELSSDYEVMEITPVDMFCETYHVECVTLLVQK